jgi:hypothetical protein
MRHAIFIAFASSTAVLVGCGAFAMDSLRSSFTEAFVLPIGAAWAILVLMSAAYVLLEETGIMTRRGPPPEP